MLIFTTTTTTNNNNNLFFEHAKIVPGHLSAWYNKSVIKCYDTIKQCSLKQMSKREKPQVGFETSLEVRERASLSKRDRETVPDLGSCHRKAHSPNSPSGPVLSELRCRRSAEAAVPGVVL